MLKFFILLNLQLNPKTYSELADYSITYGDRLLDLASPKVMGIINATSDSFYSNSRVSDTSAFLRKAEQMIDEGAYIIDLGAFSSRPSATVIEEEAEWSILESLINAFIAEFPQTLLSIDTFRSNIAERSLDCGVRMINDISAGQWDDTMFQTVQKYNAAYIMMHMRGTIGAMMDAEHLVYENIIADIATFFANQIHLAKQHQLTNIIIDPGFGFSKTRAQNYQILKNLSSFHFLSKPILIGISRKSMIYKLLDSSPEDALHGSNAASILGMIGGASIIRTHDVKETLDGIKIFKAWNNAD